MLHRTRAIVGRGLLLIAMAFGIAAGFVLPPEEASIGGGR